MLGLASLCEITDVDKEIIKKCLSFERKDFEDSVQYESALLHQVDAPPVQEQGRMTFASKR